MATASPSRYTVHVTTDDVAHASADMGTLCNTTKQSLPHRHVVRGVLSSNLVVLQKDVSSESEKNNKVRARVSPPQESPAKMMLTTPRKRLVSVEGRLAVCRPSNSKDTAIVSPTAGPSCRTHKHTDPPGNEDAADFGRTTETHIKVSVLQSRNNTVSASTPFCTSYLKK